MHKRPCSLKPQWHEPRTMRGTPYVARTLYPRTADLLEERTYVRVRRETEINPNFSHDQLDCVDRGRTNGDTMGEGWTHGGKGCRKGWEGGNKLTWRVCRRLRDKYVRSIMLKISIFYDGENARSVKLPQMRNVFNVGFSRIQVC